MKFPCGKYIFLHETEAKYLTHLPKPMKGKEICAAPFWGTPPIENTCSTYWEHCHSSLSVGVPFHLPVGAEEKLLLQRGISDYETYIQIPAAEKTTVSSLKRNFIKALLLCCITISEAAWWCSLFRNYALLQQCSTTECNLGTWPKVIIIFD